MTFILTIIFLYLGFLFDFKFKLTKSYPEYEIVHEIIYIGLLWVILDYYTILRYHSDDQPKKWIDYVVTKLEK